jgi:hypothetical protein
MRFVKQLFLLTGIWFCLTGCTTQRNNREDPHNLSNGFVTWEYYLADTGAKVQDVWYIEGDVLICSGKRLGYLYTKENYGDFVLKLEWRWPPGKKPGNGGVLIRMTDEHRIWPTSLEAQLKTGNAGDFWGLTGYRLSGPAERIQNSDHIEFGKLINLKKTKALEKPPGEWNSYEIVAKGSTVTLIINNEEVNRATGCDPNPGKICLTSEGDEIHFRNIVVTATN